MNKELNSEIILMFYKYIIISKVIPIFLKNNAYFITELLEIIPKLLISVIDLITFTLIFDKLGWVKDGQDPWMYIYFLFSAAKKKTSSNYNYSIIMNELNQSNYGFSEKYKKWMSNSNIEKILYNIKLDNINKRYIELKQPIHLNQHHIKFINYNEIVNQISSMQNTFLKYEENKLDLNILNNININNGSQNINYLVNAEALGVSMKPLDNLQIQNIVSFQSLDNQVRQKRQTLYNPQNYNNILLECNDNNSVVPLEMDVKNIYKIPNFTFNPSFIK